MYLDHSQLLLIPGRIDTIVLFRSVHVCPIYPIPSQSSRPRERILFLALSHIEI